MKKDNLHRIIAKGAGITLLGILISKLLGYIYRLIVARLGPDAYGELSLGLAVFGILSVISVLGLNFGVLRYISVYKSKNEENNVRGTIKFSMKLVFLSSVVISFFAFIFSDWISNVLFHTDKISLIIKIIVIALPFESLRSIVMNTFMSFKNIEYDLYSRIIVENVLKIFLTLIFISLGLSVISAVIAYTLSIVLSAIVGLYLLEKKVFSFLKRLSVNFVYKKEIFLYSLPLIFYSLTAMIMSWTDSLMLGYFKTTSDVGIYNAAVPTARLVGIVPLALISLYIPVMSSLLENKDQLKKIFYITTKWIILVNTLFLSLMIIFSKNILGILFGNEYVIGYSSLIVLGVGHFIYGFVYTSRDTLMVLKKTKFIFFSTLLAFFLNVILNYLLIPKYGILGASIATTIALIFGGLILFLKTLKETKIMILDWRILKIFLIGLVSSVVGYFLISKLSINNQIMFVIIGGIIVSSLYLILLYLLRIFQEEDFELLDLIKKRLGIKHEKNK
ncbi:MAG: flippase [archaeon]